MKWSIPAKTFLLGEYAAIAEASAIVMTTHPCFELTLSTQPGLSGIHELSPAGLWWQQQNHSKNGLIWYDPYLGRGGLGASSAQFLSCYLATCFLNDEKPHVDAMLRAYYNVSWNGTGLRPSGYDVIAQSQQGCVFINKQQNKITSYSWPFQDLSFFLVHTGVKLATHHHLQNTPLPQKIDVLSSIVDEARLAFEQIDSEKLVTAINEYHQQLSELHLVADHSLHFIHEFKKYPELLAIKGCGALGADILLMLSSVEEAPLLANKLKTQNWTILATEHDISFHKPYFSNSMP